MVSALHRLDGSNYSTGFFTFSSTFLSFVGRVVENSEY